MALTDEWLNGAREDLNSELEYVCSEFGVQYAEKAFHKVVDAIDTLRQFPRLGKCFFDVTYHEREVRTFSIKQTSIIYCDMGEVLLIISIWNNRRDDKNIKAMIQSRQ